MRLAAIAQMINVLPATMLLTNGSELLPTPTRQVFAEFRQFHDVIFLPTDTIAEPHVTGTLRRPR